MSHCLLFFLSIHNQDKSEYHTSQVGEMRDIISGIIGKTGIQFNQSITENKNLALIGRATER